MASEPNCVLSPQPKSFECSSSSSHCGHPVLRQCLHLRHASSPSTSHAAWLMDLQVLLMLLSAMPGEGQICDRDCVRMQYVLNDGEAVAGSIPATEHSVMTAWPTERAAIDNMIDQFGYGLFACVMDSYDYAQVEAFV